MEGGAHRPGDGRFRHRNACRAHPFRKRRRHREQPGRGDAVWRGGGPRGPRRGERN